MTPFFGGVKRVHCANYRLTVALNGDPIKTKTSEVFAGKKWPKLVASTGSLKNEQNKKCSDSQPEIYTYFKYVLKMNSHKKIVLKGKNCRN